MAFEISPIREEHIESFHACLGVVAREHIYLALLDAPPIETTREFVRDNIANGQPQYVATEAGRVIGWCDIVAKARPALRHCGVLGMGVLPEWRGCGLGRRLLRPALEAARACGLVRIELTVRADNPRAMALYRRHGFEVEGRHRKALYVDGAYHDLVAMALLFDAVPQVSDPPASTS